MRLLTLAQHDQLIKNGAFEDGIEELYPVVKLFLPGTPYIWLLGQISSEDYDSAYCLFIESNGFSRFQWINFNEILNYKTEEGFGIEVDINFNPKFALKVYQDAEWQFKRLVEDEEILKCFKIEPVTTAHQLTLFK